MYGGYQASPVSALFIFVCSTIYTVLTLPGKQCVKLKHFTTPATFSLISEIPMGSLTAPTRTAIITGGAQGLGECIALRLASEGIDILVVDISAKEKSLEGVVEKVKMKGRRAAYVVADVTDEAQVRGMVERCVEEFGGLDIVRCRCLACACSCSCITEFMSCGWLQMIANAGILHLGTIIDSTSLAILNSTRWTYALTPRRKLMSQPGNAYTT